MLSPLSADQDRLPRAWPQPASRRPASARLKLLPRLSGTALALMLVLAVGSTAVSWSRSAELHDVAYPALTDVRQLDALLGATRDALQRDDEAGLARADSLADQFHRVADMAQRRPPLHDAAVTADREFRAFYAQARRGRAADRRADTAVDGLADLTFRGLRVQLDAAAAAQRQAIDQAYQSLHELQIACGIMLGVVVLAAIALLASFAAGLGQAMSKPLEDAAQRALALAEGNFDVELRTGEAGAEGALYRALARVAAVARSNRTAAEELATGEYRLGAHQRLPEDRTGRALARAAAYLDYLSIAAQRVAEGELTVAVEPRSPEDTLGHAYAMMLQRVVTMVRDTQATAQLIAATAEEVQRAAAELTLGATAEANAGTRVAEQLASITSVSRTSAIRATELERRSLETAAAVDEGVAAVHESHEALQTLQRRTEAVGQMAHDAGLIALNAGIEVGRVGARGAGFVAVADEVRDLAAHTADAARELGSLTARGAEAATRSTAILDRLSPAAGHTISMVRELAAASQRQATEIAQAHREVSASGDVRRRAAAAAESLAATADALVGHAQRLRTMLSAFHDGTSPDDGDRATTRRLTLHKNTPETRRGVRKLALI